MNMRKINSIICFSAILLFNSNSIAENKNLFNNSGAETGTRDWGGISMTDEDSYSGKYCFKMPLKKKSGIVTSWYIFKIDPNKLYDFSVKMKSASADLCKVSILFIPHDKFMRGFGYNAIYARKDTYTELTAAANAGDSVLKIADGNKWFKHPRFSVAFYAKKDYADLPNINLSRIGISAVNKVNSHWEVKLKHPLKKSYPAGTKVRMHRLGPYYLKGLSQVTVPNDWKDFSFQFKGVRKLFESSAGKGIKKFWYGTAYVGIKIIVRGTPGKSELLLDNLTLTAK